MISTLSPEMVRTSSERIPLLPAVIVTEASEIATDSFPFRPVFTALTARFFAVTVRSSLDTTACL